MRNFSLLASVRPSPRAALRASFTLDLLAAARRREAQNTTALHRGFAITFTPQLVDAHALSSIEFSVFETNAKIARLFNFVWLDIESRYQGRSDPAPPRAGRHVFRASKRLKTHVSYYRIGGFSCTQGEHRIGSDRSR